MSNNAARLSSKSSAGSRKSDGKSPARRRSSRLSASEENLSSEAEAPPVAVKRSITVRKIAPRKTQALCDSNKENVERLSEASAPNTAVLSSILPPSAPSALHKEPEQGPVWPQKVRRSYSRLSVGDSPRSHPAPSTSPNAPETLFGFERLQTPEVMRKAEGSRLAPLGSTCFSVGSFNISAADDSASKPPEIDPSIPGVCLGKKTARRKRVQQIKMSELDALAAEMNAGFEEAESFELFVE